MASKTVRAARLLWQELTEEEQLAALVRLVRTRRARYAREFPELLSLGHGYKRVHGERTPERCLAFLVMKKSKRATPLPRFVSTTLVHASKRRWVEIPTDVEQVGGGRPHLGVNAANGVYVASSQDPQLNATGAICCLVRTAGQQDLYALSCNHVLTLSSLIAGGGVAQDAIVAARAPHIPFGKLATYFPLAPNQPNQIDAALALVDPETQWNYNGAQPSQVEMGLVEPQGCGVFTPRGLQPATWVKTFYDLA